MVIAKLSLIKQAFDLNIEYNINRDLDSPGASVLISHFCGFRFDSLLQFVREWWSPIQGWWFPPDTPVSFTNKDHNLSMCMTLLQHNHMYLQLN